MHTKKDASRKIWQMPWGYPESIAVAGGILFTGFLLQITIGSFDFYLLTAPVNLLTGAFILLFCIAASWLGRNSRFVHWFSGVPTAVCLISALLVLSLIMGITPQSASGNRATFFGRLGFDSMTGSWAFVLIYFTILLSLGCLIVGRLFRFDRKDYGFYLNHIGFWLVLFASGLGYADMERYIMHVRKGEVEWRVYDGDAYIKELPIAIQLNGFDMEEYPPKLTVIDRRTGAPQPENAPDYYQIDTNAPQGRLNGWDITVDEYIHQAVRNSDSTYREVYMPGAAPAVKVQAVNRRQGKIAAGWVCGGNQAQLYMTLPLDEQQCIVMTVPEPKRFVSDIEVYTPDGTVRKGLLEVNKPMRTGNWTIYQYGYDNEAGRLSSYSSMELVYDPWVVPVYIGFAFVALGAITLIFNGKFAKRKGNELE